jgi:hypothetical protein
MIEQTLFLAWQDQAVSRRWFPIGRLDVDICKPAYRFRYIEGAREAQARANFKPLPDFPKFDRDYKAQELFPIFSNRVMPSGRPDFQAHLWQLGLDPKHNNPVEILSVSGGRRITDEFQVFPKLNRASDGSFSCRFFVHGCSHVNDPAMERIELLLEGEKLNIALELTNPESGLAVQVQTSDYFMIGWAPRYLVNDLAMAIASSPGKYEASVVRLNTQSAPSRYRLLVEFRGVWPDKYFPMSSEQFAPLVH